MHKLLIVTAIAMAAASAAQAQTGSPAASAADLSTAAVFSTPGLHSDRWAMQSEQREDTRLRRIVAKTTTQSDWNRARRAAIAINANKCGEAAAIAAQANDVDLMAGVKRACRVG